MGRVINIDSPGKLRTQLMRTSAEILHRLGKKKEVDPETKDLTAFLFFCLREIDNGIEESVVAWEKRDYWIKSEQFRLRWRWVNEATRTLEEALNKEGWEQLPTIMVKLLPYFEDIKVVKYTRSARMWEGSYRRYLVDVKKGKIQ